MSFLPQLAFRTLFFGRQRFLGLLNSVTILCIACGVFFLLVVLSIMGGFQEELERRWVGLHAHLTLTQLGNAEPKLLEKLKQWPEVAEVNRFAEGEVILERETAEADGVVAARLRGVSELSSAFVAQAHIFPQEEAGLSAVMGGSELLASLGILPGIPETLRVVYPFGEIGPTGDWVPRQKNFRVSHGFETGIYSWDAFVLLVPYADALQLLGDQAEAGVQIRLHSLRDLERVAEKLRGQLPTGAKLTTFREQNQRLFAALKLERIAMGLLLILFLLIASFSMVGLLLMLLFGRKKELAVLRAIGLSPAHSQRLFLTFGGWLGTIGSLLGGSAGLLACWLLREYPISLPATYYLEYLPVRFDPLLFAGIMAAGILLALVSAWVPARIAGRMEILPVLREE